MAQVTFHCTAKYWNEPIKYFLLNLNYITFELNLSRAEGVAAYLMHLNAKHF